MTKKNVPKIRFSGFTEPWEQHKLSEIADLTSSKRVHAKDYVESGVPFYRGKEISELKEHKPISDVLYITKEKYEEISKLYGTPKIGDLLITAVGTLGNTWVIDNLPFYFKDGNLIWFKNIKCNSQYLDYVLSSPEGQRKIYDSAIGSSQKALTMVKLNELNFMFPNEAEQEKIVDFFKKIDKLIYLYQCKLENLKKQKKGLLQKMFPKAGAKVPEIRFPEFTGDWEQRKFDDLANYKKGPFGSALKKDIFVPKDETTVKVYEQQNAINKDWTLERYFITREYANKLESFKVKGGDIIVSCAGTIGETYEIPMDAESGIINQALMRILVNEKIVNKKMFIILFNNMIDEFTQVHSNGSAIKNIPPFSDLKPMEVLVPSMEEQNKISEFFTKIDNLISLHQRKLEHLQKQKKALLQQMFI